MTDWRSLRAANCEPEKGPGWSGFRSDFLTYLSTIAKKIIRPVARLLPAACLSLGLLCQAQGTLPAVMGKDFSMGPSGLPQISKNGEVLTALGNVDRFSLAQMYGNPTGTETGIALDFGDESLNGMIAYGSYNDSVQRPTILFLPKQVELKNGRARLEITQVFTGNSNDFMHFVEKGGGILGFRVINNGGRLLYEGRVAFRGQGPYEVLPTVVEGPLVNLLGPAGATISYDTQVAVQTSIGVDGKTFGESQASAHHEIALTGLLPDTTYKYTVKYGGRSDEHSFKTAPKNGSRKPFTFAFVADNRSIAAGGERDMGSANYQSTRAVMAAAALNHSAFLQAMGGNTTGNNPSAAGHMLEHANWKRALEPFWSSIPVYAGFGNHEENYFNFPADKTTGKGFRIARFPYETESGEAAFARSFVHPTNGPLSEGMSPNGDDFPTYKENVYYYTYGNVAMIVLNSEYWKSTDPGVSGSPEGYVMDKQLKWLDETIQKLEGDPSIDHIFVNTHSAMFPNGDHTDAGMWWFGSNDARPNVNGVRAEKGILERRDQVIDISINKSRKVVGFLTGSEHNFAVLEITPETPIYPDGYQLPKLKIKRKFYNINNGGGGAYSYAMMNEGKYRVPWNDRIRYFSGPTSLALFHVNGLSVTLEAFNPETFEPICADVKLR